MASTGVIVASCTVAAVTGEAKLLAAKQQMSVRPVAGAFFLGLGLLGLNAFAAPIATGFAVLVLVSALLVNGPALFAVIGGLQNG